MPLSELEAAQRKMARRIEKDIKKHGLSVVYVFGEDDDPSFHYTVGRTLRDLPELLIAAPLAPVVGMQMLNALNRAMPRAVPSGSKVNLGGLYPMLVLDVTDDIVAEEFTCFASRFYGEDGYRVQQVVCCDKNGKFPPDCEPPYSRQPLFG